MKLLVTSLLLTIGLGGFTSSQAERETTPQLKDLLPPWEFQEYVARPEYRDRMDLFRRVLERDEQSLLSRIKASRIDQAVQVLKHIRDLSRHAVKEAARSRTPRDQRAKQVKKLEIRTRNLLETIDGLKTVVSFRYHAEFDETARQLRALRGHLLEQIFGKALAFAETEGSLERARKTVPKKTVEDFSAAAPVAPSVPPAASNDDRFTDKEYLKIQDNQELVKRVDVFLEIAEARLKEIQRRMQKKEWEGKEENPLQFYTYWDLVHAYERAIQSIMINIDEKSRYKTAPEKDVRKSLEKLNQKITEFIPQLEQLGPLRQWAIEQQDEQLYEQLSREIQKALETSITAKKGSELGLGAPVK